MAHIGPCAWIEGDDGIYEVIELDLVMAKVSLAEEFGLDGPFGVLGEIDGTDDDLCG